MATVLAIVFYLQPGEPFLLENSLYLNKQRTFAAALNNTIT
jgi:hypothetical protein